ncbi:MAG: arginine--tRNA ligase [Sedimentisphaerales bacterium]|nr:arginine--tRNA ligase [Sedimentisphaerales bacterium]
MKPVLEILEQRISNTLAKVSGLPNCPAVVRMATDPKFGDYQVNGVMAAAKQLKTNPRQFAQKLVAELKLDDICQTPEIAGPGFINLRLTPEFLAQSLMDIHRDANLGIEKKPNPQTVVVDYSGPNIAKQMHVGHLRSTIIGDCICRMLECLGHNVIRQNHIGDWGTQFGMLVQYLYQKAAAATNGSNPAAIEKALQNIHIADLEEFYQQAKKRDDGDEAFRTAARQRVVELHSGQNPLTLTLWRQIVSESRKHYQPIYQALHITLKADDERGESFYADKLESVVKQLQDNSLAVESDGAVCVFPEGFTNKEGAPLPFIIQKSDGAFLYATTDLAAMRFRLKDLHANRIIYVTDARQALHFKMLFAVAKMAGWADDSIKLEHVTFGTMLGTDGKPFKTRTGGTVKLAELLGEAIQRARDVVEQKNSELPEEKKAQIAAAVGIGAVKYSDYSNNRDSDYIFSFDKMLAMDGNTAPYMQYAYARIKSIERKAQDKDVDVQAELSAIAQIALTDPAEIDLAKHLIRYGQSIQNAAVECRPNYLTNYLYELSGAFSRFYNACPVLQTEGSIRAARLLLCDLTARTIRHGMSQLLGIDVPEQM